jgi:hypothetical protein
MKKIIALLVLGLFLFSFTQLVGAVTFYDYNPRTGNTYVYVGDDRPYGFYRNYDRDWSRYYFDEEDLRYEKDLVYEWVQNGDGLREEALRYRAVASVADSFDNRYMLSYGRSSGDVHYYDRFSYDLHKAKDSAWRFKEAYSPSVHGTGKEYENSYYYEPRYDADSGTFNWRY